MAFFEGKPEYVLFRGGAAESVNADDVHAAPLDLVDAALHDRRHEEPGAGLALQDGLEVDAIQLLVDALGSVLCAAVRLLKSVTG